jgi:hypothetical protein
MDFCTEYRNDQIDCCNRFDASDIKLADKVYTIMPILSPAGISFAISDLASEVILKCGNRTTDLTRAYQWLVDAILEISSNPDYRDEFTELEILGPTFVLTGGSSTSASQQEYDESNIVPSGDTNDATLDIFIWRDPPINSVRQKLNPSHYQEADKSVVTFSTPTSWYRFGGQIGFYPSPDKSYQIQARILRMHPIADSAIQTTTILLPRDWNEVLIHAAAEKGLIELQEYEKAQAIHTLLHGDPKYPTKPGMINGRKKKRGREAFRITQGLRPIVHRYINR